MARLARVVIPGEPHHVTQRGNRRQKTFFCDDDYGTSGRVVRWATTGSSLVWRRW